MMKKLMSSKNETKKKKKKRRKKPSELEENQTNVSQNNLKFLLNKKNQYIFMRINLMQIIKQYARNFFFFLI